MVNDVLAGRGNFAWSYDAQRKCLRVDSVFAPDFLTQVVDVISKEEKDSQDELDKFFGHYSREDMMRVLPWADYMEEIELLEAPNLVTVPAVMFAWLPKLKAADISQAVAIGNSAFRDCVNLEVALMPKVQVIGDSAFCNCRSLRSTDGEGNKLELRECRMVSKFAFDRCESLKSVSFKKASKRTNANGDPIQEAGSFVEYLGSGAFIRCKSLSCKRVYFGGKAFEPAMGIDPNPFYGCLDTEVLDPRDGDEPELGSGFEPEPA